LTKSTKVDRILPNNYSVRFVFWYSELAMIILFKSMIMMCSLTRKCCFYSNFLSMLILCSFYNATCRILTHTYTLTSKQTKPKINPEFLFQFQSIFELSQSKRQCRMPGMMRGLAFSVYSQAQRPLRYQRDCKTLTGFGSASLSEKYLVLDSQTFSRTYFCYHLIL
jgi:hypothetical protein